MDGSDLVRGDEADPRSFREAAEAYEVLSDPGRRARYDRQFQRRRRTSSLMSGVQVPEESERIVCEPLSVVDRPEKVRPSFDSFIERI